MCQENVFVCAVKEPSNEREQKDGVTPGTAKTCLYLVLKQRSYAALAIHGHIERFGVSL